MNRDEFLKIRQTGIGGSDVAAVLGIDPYRTPLELYLEKRGELEPKPDTMHTRAGRAFESVIAHMYAERTGRVVRRSNITHRDEHYPWLLAHVDRLVVGEKRGMEAKNVGRRMAAQWTDEPPSPYIVQVQTYLLLLGYPVFDVAAFFGGADLELYEVPADSEWHELIIDRTHDFWHNHVLAGNPPEPDYEHASTLPLLKRIYKGTNGATIPCDEQLLHWVRVMEESRGLANGYDKTADNAKAHILQAMGNAAILQLGNGTQYTRKEVTRKGYFVEPATYIDFRAHKPKAAKNE